MHEKCFIIVGVGPLRSERSVEFFRKKIPGVFIPELIMARMRKTPGNKQREEGRKICVEIIQQVMGIEGVVGVHLMAYKQEDIVGEILDEAGLLPRPGKEYLQ